MLVSTPTSCINIYVDNKSNYCIYYCLCINKKKQKEKNKSLEEKNTEFHIFGPN